MKTVFKKGMKVYDQLVFPDKEGKVISVVESDDFPIKVHYKGLEINELFYTADGRYYTDIKPTLATKPYIFEGFEQKAPVPTFEEAWRSTASLDTKEMTTAIDNFRDYASKEAGIYLPTPDDLVYLNEIEKQVNNLQGKYY